MIPFAFWLACGLSSALSCRVALQYFQLESYQFGGYFRTLQRNWLRAFLPGFAVALWGCAAVTLCASLAFADWTLWMGLAITLAGAVAAWVLQRRLPAEKAAGVYVGSSGCACGCWPCAWARLRRWPLADAC